MCVCLRVPVCKYPLFVYSLITAAFKSLSRGVFDFLPTMKISFPRPFIPSFPRAGIPVNYIGVRIPYLMPTRVHTRTKPFAPPSVQTRFNGYGRCRVGGRWFICPCGENEDAHGARWLWAVALQQPP
jgi:hypothetical protein